MCKLLVVGTVVSVLVVGIIVLLIRSPVNEFDPVKILEEQGYSNVEIINEKVFGASYRGGESSISGSTATMVYTVKAISPDGKDVEAEVRCCYPFNNNPTVKINQL